MSEGLENINFNAGLHQSLTTHADIPFKHREKETETRQKPRNTSESFTSHSVLVTQRVMTVLSDTQFESAKLAASALRDASKGMRVLSSLKWDRAMWEPFLNHGKLPAPDYAPVDTTKPREAIAFARVKSMENIKPTISS